MTISIALRIPVSFFFEDAPDPAGRQNAKHKQKLELTEAMGEFLSSPEGLQLNRAVVGIRDANLRSMIIDLVEAIADSEESE